jgi:WD40 repeat protein
VRIWEPETGKLHAELIGHLRWVMTLDWTRDCSGMVTGADDGSVRLWEMETLQTVAVLSRRPAIKQAHDGACNWCVLVVPLGLFMAVSLVALREFCFVSMWFITQQDHTDTRS